MGNDKTERRSISMPPDWWAAFEAMAEASETPLSEWMGERCKTGLPLAVRRALSVRRSAGRPKEQPGRAAKRGKK
jgi:hypothetical protein